MKVQRLIDSDVVKEYLKRAIFGADVKIDGWVDAMPAADAVPVEWLKKMRDDDRLTIDDVETIDLILAWRQKEQEAKDGKAD